MTPETFLRICDSAESPGSLSEPLESVYQDRRGDWDHAYLHREEGDISNSRYWYNRAGRPIPSGPLEKESHAIAAELCEQPDAGTGQYLEHAPP